MLKNHGNLLSEPNNDSPMNAQAAALWSDKAEMRQRILFEHKKSESQWNWQMTAEFKIVFPVTDILKLSPMFLTLWTSVLSMCTVTSKEHSVKAIKVHHCICWFNVVFMIFRVIYFHSAKCLLLKNSSTWILFLLWIIVATDYNMSVTCWILVHVVFW